MFFKHLKRSATQHRKDHALFFGSLVVAIVAFYTLLSLGEQDVMRFLKTIESDAVHALFTLVPIVYGVSLFFVFFLVYFANAYQLDRRRKELGIYLMHGMARTRLFGLLMTETLVNSAVALAMGIPIALLLTEGISLITIKMIGMGVVGHRISLSPTAIGGTAAGLYAVQLISMMMLSLQYARVEPVDLMRSAAVQKQTLLSMRKSLVYLGMGSALLVAAYITGVRYLKYFEVSKVAGILITGTLGTFLFYKGLGAMIGRMSSRSEQQRLFAFNRRQIQENVLNEYKAMAVSSLLVLLAIACITFGIGVIAGQGMDQRTADFSFYYEESKVKGILQSKEVKDHISVYYPMYIHMMKLDDAGVPLYPTSYGEIINVLQEQPDHYVRNNLIDNFKETTSPYLLKVSSYNNLARTIGKAPMALSDHEVALFSSKMSEGDHHIYLEKVAKAGVSLKIEEASYRIRDTVIYDSLGADRGISVFWGLVVSDENYDKWAHDPAPHHWNALLDQVRIAEKGLTGAALDVKVALDGKGLTYESYLAGMGRKLFYTVGASYLTIYMGVLFLVIANTVIGIKFLIQLRENRRRYRTLYMLGASQKDLKASVDQQIRYYFLMVFGVGGVSAFFAIWTMHTSFLRLPASMPMKNIIILTAVAFVLLLVLEYIYVYAIERTADKELAIMSSVDKEA